jgi:hypothetical protein
MNIQKLKLCIVPIPFNKITPHSIIYYKKALIFKISAFLFNFILRMYHTTIHKTFPSLQIEGNVLSFQKL